MRNKIRNKYKKGNDIFNLKEEEKKEIKTHPKKSILLEEYIKRNEYKPEKSHIKMINTQNYNFSSPDKYESTFQFRGNRCKLREEQEEKNKHPRTHSKKITQPNYSYNMTSILRRDLNDNKYNYKSIRRTNYKYNNLDNAYDIIFKNDNKNNTLNNNNRKNIPNRIKRLKDDHVKDLIIISNNENQNQNKIPTQPNKVPYETLIKGIKDNRESLYTN